MDPNLYLLLNPFGALLRHALELELVRQPQAVAVYDERLFLCALRVKLFDELRFAEKKPKIADSEQG